MSLSSVKSVISRADIDQALDVLSTLTWRDGYSKYHDYSKEIKRNQELRANHDIRLKAILQNLQQTIWTNPEFQQIAHPHKGAALRFNRCADGGFYGPHADACIMAVPPIRSDLSVTLFLTDDYEGGELVIDGTPFKGKAGDIVVYPSYYVHEVKPVTKGERICAVMWVQSMVRSKDQRELLSRFYRLGLSLKEKESFGTDYIEATSIHNNLLRMWAET